MIDFKFSGVYTATLEITTDMGTSRVTNVIEIPRQPGHSSDLRPTVGRVAP